ncbi:MAG: hypothetical protein IID51_07915 [Proteobacteria bacterium]|nr:hypothetical protein [Pseudomonadota bacterium]
MQITSDFDGGNIAVLEAKTPGNIRLEIARDNQSDFYQWFYFRLSGAKGQPVVMHMENAGGSAYAEGWQDYRAVAASDGETWERVDTEYDGATLTIRHTPGADAVHYAYFVPYSMRRHADLVARAAASPLVSHRVLGKTLDGRDMDLLSISSGQASAPLNIWFIARQHPGETMAEWWMEGFLDRILDADDPVSRALLGRCNFYIIPNMNPDGSARGHLRTNAAGMNLNREWNAPSMEKSPEVFLTRAAMHETGVDFHMDVHGDEVLPYNFIAGFEGVPGVTDRQLALLNAYTAKLAALSPDFQTLHGYPPDKPGSADMRKCTDYVAENFACLAMTLEMPFKDNADLPEPLAGWSPARCRLLARSCIDALHAIIDDLK